MPFIFNKGALDDNASLFVLLMNLGNRSLAKEMENNGKLNVINTYRKKIKSTIDVIKTKSQMLKI